LLAGAHIGASGHHIISQGEADKILNANLKERREMLEDALGLKIYHYKREESLRKLDKTEENLKQVESLRKEIAPHIRFLEKQVEKVEKAREMRLNLETMYGEYFRRESIYIKAERARIDQEKLDPEAKKRDLENQLAEAKATLERSDGKDKKSEELLTYGSRLHQVRTERDSLMHQIGRLEGQIASEERIIKKQHELAQSNETKLIQLKEVETVATDIYRKIDEAELQEDSATLKSILRGIRDMLGNFITHNRTQTDTSLIGQSEEEIRDLKNQKEEIQIKITATQEAERILTEQYTALQVEIEREKDKNRDAEKAVFRIMAEQNEIISQLHTIESHEEKLRIIEADFNRELQEAAVLVGRNVLGFDTVKILAADGFELPLENIVLEPRTAQDDRRKAIERIKIRLEDAGGGSGEEVLKEYNETKERDGFLAREIEDLQKSAETLRVLIKDLEEKLDIEFKSGVEKINKQFNDFFTLMFGGGSAGLQVVREQKRKKKSDLDILGEMIDEDGAAFASETEASDEPMEEGIDISINLPQKKIKALMMLSGGERALTSIALLFAISQVNPPPFIILDETDAALDEANSRKYGDMIDNLSKYSQLIVITHNRETMSRAGILYGVTMGSEGFSKLLSIKFDEAVSVAK
ncbi:MAG: Smc, chromosome segregation ATPase, chromosome segregation protein, partial [Candidatus Paceibacter sp.]|nr:Smc, chromosome segregation ATPase, chromosome segregation protein [Candidatus Paceibacter sp.]